VTGLANADRCRPDLGRWSLLRDSHLSGEGTYLVVRIRARKRQQPRIGTPEAALTANAGLAAISEVRDVNGRAYRGAGCGGRTYQAADLIRSRDTGRILQLRRR
jgi:hypothetical protein